ncbi:MAG: SHOCT domain-containing protein [Methanothrix sp.]|nr:SHOCT domain-containing protein [Methanothrix sp.]MDD4447733.1 SHOCT domain-containing protein [Methanothrix sp.]
MPYYHMMDWFPFMGFGTVFSWFISLAVAYLVYKDAERRNMNGLLWGLPILIPWIGILFLILYLIMRDSGHRQATQSSAPSSSVPARTVAEEVLDERYARGELTREIYLQMKEDLKNQQKIEE